MLKVLTKPRWKAWEKTCIKEAYEKKVQLKVMARALGRSPSSINSKIENLGLRKAHLLRSRGNKIQKSSQQSFFKTISDQKTMAAILKVHAPLTYSEKPFRERAWTLITPVETKSHSQEGKIEGARQDNVPFALAFPLEYILSKDHAPEPRCKSKVFGDPYYVSLTYVEKWAANEGFRSVERELQSRGIFYWKEGAYFSRAQLLIYINRVRLEKRLQPLAFEEEELSI